MEDVRTDPAAVGEGADRGQGSLATTEFNVRSARRSRSDLRSVTFQGIADAMASQWGGLL